MNWPMRMKGSQFIATAEVTLKGRKGILPKMAETFRLRIYNKFPRRLRNWNEWNDGWLTGAQDAGDAIF